MKENNMIFHKRIKHILICIGLALFLVSAAIPSSISYAQRRVKPEMMLPSYYPDGFDGMGRIDMISEGKMVIDDRIVGIAPYVQYFTLEEMNVPGDRFRAGNFVGFIKNSDNEIISMWLLE